MKNPFIQTFPQEEINVISPKLEYRGDVARRADPPDEVVVADVDGPVRPRRHRDHVQQRGGPCPTLAGQ